jgi:membrane protease subunit HflC
MRILIGIIVVLLLALLAWTSVFTVDRGEYVYLTQFGRPVATYDGATDGGLHNKLPWPVQAVQSLDRRLQYFDLPEMELLTHDPDRKTIDKTLTVVASVCWRIKDVESVDVFVRRLGSPDRARAVLGEQVRGQLGSLISKKRMDALISVGPSHESLAAAVQVVTLDRSAGLTGTPFGLVGPLVVAAAQVSDKWEHLQGQLLARVRQSTAEYGIEIVDIRLRRVNHPAAVRDAIFARIRSERQMKVADYQSEGSRLADKIRTDADSKARELLAEANAEEQKVRGEAETEADNIRNLAHRQDVEFYAFLKKLEEYQRILGDNKSMLLLSSRGEMFDLLFKPPKPNGSPGQPGGAVVKPGGP